MIRNTKKILSEEFIKLAKNRTFDTIMIKEITENCGAGRQTFYNHFEDKINLVKYINNSFKKQFIKLDDQLESISLKALLEKVLQMLQANKHYFLSGIKFPETINTQSLLKEIFNEYFEINAPQKNDSEYGFLSEYTTNSLASIFIVRLKSNDHSNKEFLTIETCEDEDFISYLIKSVPPRLKY
ncbi:MAG: hypothetical protein RR549_01825 [Oscillospiraceae bacterium]